MNQYEKWNLELQKLQKLQNPAGCFHFTFWVNLMPLVFTYGTLEIPEVMEAVTGQVFPSREATAKDFVRYLIQDRVYPGMTPAQGETTSGRLYDGVDSRTLHILDEFEDEVYSRQLITVETQEGERFEAFSYIIPLEHQGLLTSQPWCLDHFIAHYLPEYVRSCQAFYGNVEKSRQPSPRLRLTSQRFHACRSGFA